jgi:NAD(P)-dependent dehydrogenase (short-subunit alcohol dehydrogenase family)
MDFDLKGKRVLVTGGSRGIGRGIAIAAAIAGANVLTCHRRGGAGADELTRALAETAGEHRILVADMADPADVGDLIGECRSHFGGLDVLINNVGLFAPKPYADVDAADWQAAINGNLNPAHRLIHGSLDLLGDGSSIVNIGATVAFIGMTNGAHYTAAKAALVGMTRSLARELGPRNIRVNVLSPGRIETDAWDAMPEQVSAEQRRLFSSFTALGRLGKVEEIANVALFLASDLSSYITGQNIHVNGCV